MTTTKVTQVNGKTYVTLVLTEGEVWDGVSVSIAVRRDNYMDGLYDDVVAHVDLEAMDWYEEGKDGSLHICSWEEANPDTEWANTYPDYLMNYANGRVGK